MDTMLATSVQILERTMRRLGVDPGPLFERHGLDRRLLADPAARVSQDAADALVRELAERVSDPAFGLQAARCWHPTHLGALGHAWLASSTLRRGVERMQRYWRLLGGRTAVSLREEPGGLAVVLDNPRRDPVVAAATTDMNFAVLVDMCRVNAGEAFAPVELRLIRPEPADRRPYEAFYGCPVRFGAPERALVLPAAELDAPLPTANRQLAGLLDDLLAEELARLDRDDVPARCRALLLRRLSSGELGVDRIAADLAMSRRTLHRRLADAGTTWQDLLDDARRDLALRRIEDPRRSIGEIAFELGFSQQSAFARAFRRWAGASPTAYRDALAARRAADRPGT